MLRDSLLTIRQEVQLQLRMPDGTRGFGPNSSKPFDVTDGHRHVCLHPQEVHTMPQPRMPDGTRGFEAGPWCERRLPLRPTPSPPGAA